MAAISSALITGATGFIGSALVRRLASANVDVTCLIRAGSANNKRLSGVAGIKTIEIRSFSEAELTEKLSAVRAEVVFNLAAYGVRQADRNPERMLEGNLHLLVNLLRATSDWPLKRFIHTGSCSEYRVSKPDRPITEECEVLPKSLYGAAKAAAVIFGNSLARHLTVPFLTLRLFGVYGFGEPKDRLIPCVVSHLSRDIPVDLTAGEQTRDLLYIDDVVDAFLAAADNTDLSDYSIYNICSGIPVQVRTVAKTVADEMHKPHNLLLLGKKPYRSDEPMWLVGSNKKFARATGWLPQVNLKRGIRNMIESCAP